MVRIDARLRLLRGLRRGGRIGLRALLLWEINPLIAGLRM
jgi:hypothetical protein